MIRRIFVFFGYLLIGLIIIGVTLLLVAYGDGYEYSFKTGKIVQKGLVLISSTPNGALITRADNTMRKHTAYHATYFPGSYTFNVSKPNYRTWSKTLTVAAGQVTDARYIWLLPNTLTQSTVATTNGFADETVTFDDRHLAYVAAATPNSTQSVWTIDLPSGSPTYRFNLPQTGDPKQRETIDALQWSKDGSHLMIFSHNASGTVVRVMAADGSNLINLTKTFGLNFNGLSFAPTDYHLIFGIDQNGDLREINLNSNTLSSVLANKVNQFSYANDRLLYVQSTNLGKTLSAFSVGSPTVSSRLIPSLPDSSNYTLSYSSYQGTDELIVIPSSTREAMYYSGIFGSSPISTVVARNVDRAQFTADGRFVALYSNNNLITYDAMLSKPNQIVVYQAPSVGSNLIGLSWVDGYHLLLDLDGQSVFADFDGTNRQSLTKTNDIPFPGPDLRSAFSIVPSNDGKAKLIDTLLH